MSIRFFPRRGFLAAVSGAALALSESRLSRAGEARAFSRLDIGPPKSREVRTCVENASIEAVCTELALALPAPGRQPLRAETLRRAIQACYPDAVERSLPPRYLWVYVNGEWVLWCFETVTFLVARGAGSDVLVTLEEWQPLS